MEGTACVKAVEEKSLWEENFSSTLGSSGWTNNQIVMDRLAGEKLKLHNI